MRCQDAGHEVRAWIKAKAHGEHCPVGDGIIQKVDAWEPWMGWADIIIPTDNAKYIDALEPFFRKGFPIFGANREGAKLELDREHGQNVLKEAGVDIVPFEVFRNYDKAIAFALEAKKTYVSKPMGDGDKALSFVPDDNADLVYKLKRWKEKRMAPEFMLQEKIDGIEFAIGGWFGPDGWSKWRWENFEFKKFANDDLGQTCGEAGTVGKYVDQSELFDLVLDPCTDYLHSINYVGYADLNCIIRDDAIPGPMEWTTRFGWPNTHNQMAVHKGDPVRWIKQKMSGEDALKVSEDVSVSVVMTTGDAPFGHLSAKEVSGVPIRGITDQNQPHIHWCEVQNGVAPAKVGGKVRDMSMLVTAGDYVCVVTGTGKTVKEATAAAYEVAWSLKWPANRNMRTDLGARLEDEIPALRKLGFAKDWK